MTFHSGNLFKNSGLSWFGFVVRGGIEAGNVIILASKQTAQPKAAKAEVEPCCVSDSREGLAVTWLISPLFGAYHAVRPSQWEKKPEKFF